MKCLAKTKNSFVHAREAYRPPWKDCDPSPTVPRAHSPIQVNSPCSSTIKVCICRGQCNGISAKPNTTAQSSPWLYSPLALLLGGFPPLWRNTCPSVCCCHFYFDCTYLSDPSSEKNPQCIKSLYGFDSIFIIVTLCTHTESKYSRNLQLGKYYWYSGVSARGSSRNSRCHIAPQRTQCSANVSK